MTQHRHPHSHNTHHSPHQDSQSQPQQDQGGKSKDGKSKTWKQAGSVTPTKEGQKTPKVVHIKESYVVVGFEVEQTEKARRHEVHDLGTGEYGHAYFYVVKEDIVVEFFSFGPAAAGSNLTGRKGTHYYQAGDDVQHLFRVNTTNWNINSLLDITKRKSYEIDKGMLLWGVLGNHTCASTAKELLDNAGIDTPSAQGPVTDLSQIDELFSSDEDDNDHSDSKAGRAIDKAKDKTKKELKTLYFTVDDPWAWWAAFIDAGNKEIPFKKDGGLGDTPDAIKKLIGNPDPVASRWTPATVEKKHSVFGVK